ncbi:hypothetical protein, partial [Archangium sp.]|uniref:hypothetical protein n=1 Tax=Archangium sp. TaxID=1872627 RepID=UPI002D272121
MADTDSPEVREVMKRVAPALEFNLRRLKQFLNVFRLSIYIANHTGLFDAGHALTLSQLGKFVAESYTGPSRHQKVRPPGSRRASTRRPSAPTR